MRDRVVTVIRNENVSRIIAQESIMLGKRAKPPGRSAKSSPRTISHKLQILVESKQTVSKTYVLLICVGFLPFRAINVPENIMLGQ